LSQLAATSRAYLISIAGIADSLAAMLTVVTILQGAVANGWDKSPAFNDIGTSALSHDYLEGWAASSDVLRGVHGAAHRLFPLPDSGRFSLTQ
jgi:hypothetical protein